MKAVVKYAEGEGNIELREVPEPDVGEKEVKIKVEAAGICGSDLHIYKWNIGIPTKVPFIIGHEFSGTIAEVGKNVQRFHGLPLLHDRQLQPLHRKKSHRLCL
jgi:D-arabinose 1-dehydrogenase-like Zn-dependent alcohol dehydrogenase